MFLFLPSSYHIRFGLILLMAALINSAVVESAEEPYRLENEFTELEWLSMSGHQRTRYEGLDGQFRSGVSDNISMFAFRSALEMDLEGDGIGFRAELMDSRQEGLTENDPIGTSIVNAMELVQAHATIDLSMGQGGQLKVGRYTMDLTTRRFVARNRYRNTVNNFNGIHLDWKTSGDERIQLFYNLPVRRRVSEKVSLLNNRIRVDEEDFNQQFWGAYLESPHLFGNTKGDVFFFGLHESDGDGFDTRNRQLYTGGFRAYQSAEAGRGDFEIEAAFQVGKSRASRSPTDLTDLDHGAGFLHLEAGYTFETALKTRFAFQFDYSSGDKDPNDNENNRFDTLYGARRFDYGPTGTYGTFARSNLISPAYRITFSPAKDVAIMIAHRFNWLASDTDSWTTGGIRDITGESGSYLGHQPEVRVRWEAIPGNLRVEAGLAHLFIGEFIEDAPNSTISGDSTYGYIQSIFTF